MSKDKEIDKKESDFMAETKIKQYFNLLKTNHGLRMLKLLKSWIQLRELLSSTDTGSVIRVSSRSTKINPLKCLKSCRRPGAINSKFLKKWLIPIWKISEIKQHLQIGLQLAESYV